jgi:hypothetical protein
VGGTIDAASPPISNFSANAFPHLPLVVGLIAKCRDTSRPISPLT